MYALEKIKQDIAAEISRIIKTEIISSDFVIPPQAVMGDLSLPLFSFAKKIARNPIELGTEIATGLKTNKWAENISLAGPYLNIRLNNAAQVLLLKDIEKLGPEYGKNKSGAKKRVMLEYANGNTHKEYHVGHLRNIAYGDAVNRILAANGWTTIPVSYVNDFGIHAAKTLWYYLQTKAVAPKDNKGYFLGQLYAASTKAIEENPEAKAEVGKIMQGIESKKGDAYKLWKATRLWSIKQMQEVNKELGIDFKVHFYESDFIDAGFKIVKELEEKGILVKSQGAIIANLEEYKLGVLVVIRSDGTGLYPVADLPLTIHKVKKYRLDTSLWVVDVRQGQYFKQLFKVLELYGLKANLQHLPYEFVTLPSGMMSSRSGNVIPYEDLKQEALKKTTQEVSTRHSDWTKKKIENAARILALGALKFEMVKVGAEKIITFDMDSALRFDGYTCAYIQYCYARIQSIKRKAPATWKKLKIDFAQLNDIREKGLIMKLAHFPNVVFASGEKKDPAEITKYLFDLAQAANDYYHAINVLKADQATGAARLSLLHSVAFVIKQGLDLLGIETLEEM